MGIPCQADAMDRIECSAVYIDERVKSERWVRRNSADASAESSASSFILEDEPETLHSNVDRLLDVCKQIYLCHAGTSFATKLAELTDNASNDCTPIFAFFDIDFADESFSSRRKVSRTSWPELEMAPPSPSSLRRGFTFSSQSEETYGLQLLSGVSADVQVREGPNLIIPIAILRGAGSGIASQTVEENAESTGVSAEQRHRNLLAAEPRHVSKCLDAGAVDVLTSPLDKGRTHGLLVHAYRTRKIAQKELSRFLARRKLRKQSWVGVHDEQPYAYLREAMVSKLMKGICNPEEVIEEFQDRELDVAEERQAFVREQIGSWNFTAHQFSEDELVFGACEMLQHALDMPEVDRWRLTPGELRTFLLACRAAYNSFVLYHNFRHAIDVLQSLFCFLLHIGALPPYGAVQAPVAKSPIASLLSPFDALTLLISAIGHDVGHPGVNNFFLVKLNAPLAQLYNDNSVLEAFHCAAFSQILRRHWPVAFKDHQLRKLLISSILATDMGVHQKFMERLGNLQEKYHENNESLDGWKPQDLDQYKTLLCGLLIKCADISNVARPWDVAERWTKILQEEFANQGEMEREVGMETALFGGPPELGNIFKLATGQIGFMSIFALPLFEGVADILPQMTFTVEQIRSNQAVWRQLADREVRKKGLQVEKFTESVSPRTRSPNREAEDSKPAPVEGYFDSAELSSVEQDDATSDHDATGEYYESSHSSLDSVSRSALNENTISPVVSSDTPGPSMEITGTPMPSETPSRKSSSAIPDVTVIPFNGAPRERNGSVQTQYHSADGCPPLNANRASGDSSILAAVLFANAPTNGGDSADHSSGNERPSSSQRCHHRNSITNSSKRASGSNRHSCTRTHSVSTYSNTAMTPISPATNATSFLTVDSGDEKDGIGRSVHEERDASSTRPSSSDAYDFIENHHDGSHSSSHSQASHHADDLDKSHIMATINGGSSPAHSTITSGSAKNDGYRADDHLGGEYGARKLLKRRSRLRLAFWKRKGHHSHQQGVSGET